MFECIQAVDERLYNRYLTLERNIKSGSNSFYDAYLDMLEQFVKVVLTSYNFDVDSKCTCGKILLNDDVQNLFKKTLEVDDFTYKKMRDYTSKINAHKHRGEKEICIDTIVAYMKVLYDAISAYCKVKSISIEGFDSDHYSSIFKVYERENLELRAQANALQSELEESVEQNRLKEKDLEEFRSLITKQELEKLSLEDQNAVLQKKISKLKDIKISSMEEKLNKTIDLLLELQAAVVENRAIAYAVGDTICGSKQFESFVEKARGVLPAASKQLGKANGVLSKAVAIAKGVNKIIEGKRNNGE